MNKKVLFAASEYGSFGVIYPVLTAALKKYEVGYVGVKDIQLPGLIFSKKVSDGGRLKPSELEEFDLFVTGSTSRLDMEYGIWDYAASHGKKTVCVLDQHKNLIGRFQRGRKRIIPDALCVMNEEARKALINIGVERRRISVTGSPYLSSIAAFKTSNRVRSVLRKAVASNEEKVITFCTEYIAKTHQGKRYGYDERSVLSDIIADLNRRTNRRFILYIRLHPNDDAGIYKDYIKKPFGNLACRIMKDDPDYRMLQVSDMVVGMSSIILVVADMLGLPIISYQPTHIKKSIFKFDGTIAKHCITDKEGLAQKIGGILTGVKIAASGVRMRICKEPVKKIIEVMDRCIDS